MPTSQTDASLSNCTVPSAPTATEHGLLDDQKRFPCKAFPAGFKPVPAAFLPKTCSRKSAHCMTCVLPTARVASESTASVPAIGADRPGLTNRFSSGTCPGTGGAVGARVGDDGTSGKDGFAAAVFV